MLVKQNSIHKTSTIRRIGRNGAVLCVLCTSPVIAGAPSVAKGFGEGVATVRLVAAHAAKGGIYHAGISITMPPGSHTYWKEPGDAGVPPVFAFNGSTNIAKAEVLFPVPTRIKEEGLEAFGYTDQVTFPVAVTAADPSKPATLHVEINYAVCNRICIPAKSASDLTLPVSADADEEKLITTALASVPVPLPAAQRGDLTLTRIKDAAKPTWSVVWTGQPAITDVFAEAPEGFTVDTRAGSSGSWTLVVSQSPPGPASQGMPATLTLAGADHSFVTISTLDLSSATP